MNTTTTMNATPDLLQRMTHPLVAPKVRVVRGASWTPAPAVRRNAEPALWRVTLAAARETVAERLLFWSVAVLCLGSITWLALMTWQFLLAWQSLVAWVRAAMV